MIPADEDLSVIRRSFDNERFRVEHLLNISGHFLDDVVGTSGINVATTPATRNVVLSLQPSLLFLDGELFRTLGFPYAQELWPIPAAGHSDLWHGLSWRPRAHHHEPAPVFMENDIPFTLNTDPPAVRDPRPALTVVSAVARTPAEIDPGRWVGQDGAAPLHHPPDYLVGKVYTPLGLTQQAPDNPMQLTVEQALSAMTFWAAYVSGREDEIGAIAAPAPRNRACSPTSSCGTATRWRSPDPRARASTSPAGPPRPPTTPHGSPWSTPSSRGSARR